MSSSPFGRVSDDVLREVLSHVAGPGRHYRSIAATSRRFRDVHCSDKPILLLSNGLLNEIFSFVGEGDYRFVAGTCRRFQQVYVFEEEQGRETKTTWDNAVLSIARAELCMEDAGNRQESEGLRELSRQQDLQGIFKAAVNAGRVDFLDWTLVQGLPLEEVHNHPGYYFPSAVEEGHVNLLEWADAHNLDWFDPSFSLRGAAEHGRVNVMEYIMEHKSPNLEEDAIESLLWNAMKDKRIAVLQWMEGRSLLTADLIQSNILCLSGHDDTAALSWLYDNGYVKDSTIEELLRWSMKYKWIVVLQWMKDRDLLSSCQIHSFIYVLRDHDDLAVLSWLYDNGYAIRGRHVQSLVERALSTTPNEALCWLQEHPDAFNADLCTFDAKRGELLLLQRIQDHGYPQDLRVLRVAGRGGFKDPEHWAITLCAPSAKNLKAPSASSAQVISTTMTGGKIAEVAAAPKVPVASHAQGTATQTTGPTLAQVTAASKMQVASKVKESIKAPAASQVTAASKVQAASEASVASKVQLSFTAPAASQVPAASLASLVPNAPVTATKPTELETAKEVAVQTASNAPDIASTRTVVLAAFLAVMLSFSAVLLAAVLAVMLSFLFQ